MKTRTFVTTLFAATLIAVPAAVLAGHGNGQGQRQGADRQAPQYRAQAERGQRDMASDRLRMHDRADMADQDRMRDQDRMHDQDRVRDQDRIHAPAGMQQDGSPVYGYNLMSAEERNAYHERIRNAESPQEREQIEARHREEMRVRAANQGIKLEEPVQTQAGRDEN